MQNNLARVVCNSSRLTPAEPLLRSLHWLPVVYRGVVIAKLLYAASAWWGFTSADDKTAFSSLHSTQYTTRQGFCAPDFANFSDIIDSADDDLFKQILSNPNHVLAPLLPVKAESRTLQPKVQTP